MDSWDRSLIDTKHVCKDAGNDPIFKAPTIPSGSKRSSLSNGTAPTKGKVCVISRLLAASLRGGDSSRYPSLVVQTQSAAKTAAKCQAAWQEVSAFGSPRCEGMRSPKPGQVFTKLHAAERTTVQDPRWCSGSRSLGDPVAHMLAQDQGTGTRQLPMHVDRRSQRADR